ncbi:MAG: AMP-binding protein [Alcanivoracaceae bacterium]|nr:AMP-binding protein [Alcanivoracaceae bacterium]
MNFCEPIVAHAKAHPEQVALVIPRMEGQRSLAEETVTYGQLLNQVARFQDGLKQAGFGNGDRVLVVLRPGVALYALTLALLASAMVPVFVDSGMPRRVIRAAIRAANVKAVVSHRKLLRLAWLLPELRRLPRFAEEGRTLGCRALDSLKRRDEGVRLASCQKDDKGLITFTSGSTGNPKGANRTHGSLVAQHRAIRRHWPDQPGDVDMPCFPVLVLHNLSCGMTTVMPRTDLATPGDVQGGAIIEQINQQGVTRLSGAPAFIRRVAEAAIERPGQMASLREVVIGGATVSPPLQQLLTTAFPDPVRVRIVYGSTEAEPIADGTLAELARVDDPRGYPVGHIAEGCELAVVATDRPLDTEQAVDAARLEAGCCGEILVRGDHVLQGYVDNPAADRENKIPCASGLVWHRTGDTGFVDEQGCLWLCGRLKDRLTVNGNPVDVLPLEKALDQLDGVERAALVQDPHRPAIAVCLQTRRPMDGPLLDQIVRWQQQQQLGALAVYPLTIPVDRRHNSKIDRAGLVSQLQAGKHKPSRLISASRPEDHRHG